MKARTLYLCYFGLREPLVQTQVLPYLRQLRQEGIEVSILTFEPEMRTTWNEKAAAEWRSRLEADGIRWRMLPYHKRPSLPATLYDIAAGALAAARIAREDGVDVFHARGQVAGAMGLLAKRLTGKKFLFDIRGFMAEEYVDAGIWPAGGRNFRLTKAAERKMIAGADAFVVLTERARDILFPGSADRDPLGRPIQVIPCCVDRRRFQAEGLPSREEVRREMGLDGRRVLAYTGSLGTWYLTDEMAELFAAAYRRDPSTFLMILTQSPPEEMAERLDRLGVPEKDRMIRKVSPGEIPKYLRAADLAVSFIKACYSKQASSPTKMAEYLACGLPVLCNPGVGDVDAVVETDRIGILVREFSEEGYRKALAEADRLCEEPGLAERCMASAAARFDLEQVGGERYRRLYRRLLGGETD